MINIKGQKFIRYMPSKCKVKPFQTNTKWSYGSSLPSASLSHFIIIKVQAHQASSILNGPRGSKWPNFALLHIWFATSWLSLKFVSMFFWIQKFHVAFNELCLCIYIYFFKNKKQKNSKKKKFQDFQIFPKKKENFLNEKSLWTRGIEPLSDFKKKKFFELGALDFLVTFFKKAPFFFLSNISRFFKVFFSKWYMRIPWTKRFVNCDV